MQHFQYNTHSQAPHFWLVPGCVAWALGIGLQLQQVQLWMAISYACLLVLASTGFVIALLWRAYLKKTTHGKARFAYSICLVLFLLALLSAAFAITGWRAAHFATETLDATLIGKDIRIHGTVASLPRYENWGSRFVLQVKPSIAPTALSATTGLPSLPKRILVSWYYPWGQKTDSQTLWSNTASGPHSVRAGQTWEMTLRLKDVHGHANPFGFDYELWLWQQSIGATAYVRSNRKTPKPVLRKDSIWNVARLRQNIRDAIFTRVQDSNTAGLIAALAVGDQSAISRDSWRLFRDTGVVHLVSISGLHITVFATLAAFCAALVWRFFARRGCALCLHWPLPHFALGAGVLLALLYAVLSGLALPAQRTTLMLALFASLHYLGLRWPWYVVWLLALALLLGWDPWGVYQPGFWLSFVAVAILFAAGTNAATTTFTKTGLKSQQHTPMQGEALFARFTRLIYGLGHQALDMAKVLLHNQIIIVLVLSPLVLLFFHQVALVGVVANLLAVPWVTLLLMPLSLLGMVYPPLWSLAADSGQMLHTSLALIADWPWAQWQHAALPAPYGVVLTVLAGVGGVLLVLPWPWSLRAVGVGFMLPLLLWRPASPEHGAFTVLAPDIGQGSAILVQTENHSVLFDTGASYRNGSDAGEWLLLPLLRALGVKPDMLILSHADKDHVGGAKSLQKAFPKAQMLGSTPALRNCTAPRTWVWDGVVFRILYPPAQIWQEHSPGQTRPKTNALSCVLLVQTQKAAALFTGDIGKAQEIQLVMHYGAELSADVLMVPHHGSKTSSGSLFLETVSPRFAVVQAGYRNRFGHPHAEVLARYASLGIPVFVSAYCGAWSWHSARPLQSQCERNHNAHYWHAHRH